MKKLWKKIKTAFRKEKIEYKDIWAYDRNDYPNLAYLNAALTTIKNRKKDHSIYNHIDLQTPKESLLLYGFRCGRIVAKYEKVARRVTPEEIIEEVKDNGLVIENYKYHTCINQLVVDKCGISIDFFGIRGRKILDEEIERLHEEVFYRSKDYQELLRVWEKEMSEAEKFAMFCESVKYAYKTDRGSKRYIVAALPQEFINDVIIARVPPGKLFLLKYLKNPVKYFWYIREKRNKDNYSLTSFGKHSTNTWGYLQELGWLYLHINLGTLESIHPQTLRRILKSQTKLTKELQSNAFYSWLIGIFDTPTKEYTAQERMGEIYAYNLDRDTYLRENILILAKYTRIERDLRRDITWEKKEALEFIKLLRKRPEPIKINSLIHGINKRVETMNWLPEKVIKKIISLYPRQYILRLPDILLKSVKADNGNIYDVLGGLYDAVSKIISEFRNRSKDKGISKLFAGYDSICWLEYFFTPEIGGMKGKWENVDDYIKDHILLCIQGEKSRLENIILTDIPKARSKRRYSNLRKHSPLIPWVGEDFSVYKSLTEDLENIRIESNSSDKRENFKFSSIVVDSLGDIKFSKEDEGTDADDVEVDDNTEWIFICTKREDLQLSGIHFDSETNKVVWTVNILKPRLENLWIGAELNFRVFGVIHVPTKRIFYGFKSRGHGSANLWMTLSYQFGCKELVDRVIKYLTPLTKTV